MCRLMSCYCMINAAGADSKGGSSWQPIKSNTHFPDSKVRGFADSVHFSKIWGALVTKQPVKHPENDSERPE